MKHRATKANAEQIISGLLHSHPPLPLGSVRQIWNQMGRELSKLEKIAGLEPGKLPRDSAGKIADVVLQWLFQTDPANYPKFGPHEEELQSAIHDALEPHASKAQGDSQKND